MLASNAAIVVGTLIATSPWTSGLYTWYVQRSLDRATRAVVAAGGSKRATTATPDGSGPRSRGRDGARGREAMRDAWAREDALAWAREREGEALGRLEIPRIGLDLAVVKGVRDADLRRGPGWVPSTSGPGSGNCGISGHRTTWLAPFREIDRLEPGDVVRLETRAHRYTYRVARRTFVLREDADVLWPTRDPTLTLTSCHPPYSDRFRIVVEAALVDCSRR